MYCLGVLMVFGTLYYIVAIQMNRSSSDKQETQHESLNRSKIAIQKGDFVHDPEISKEALPDETKMGSVVTKVAGAAEVAVEDISPNVVRPTRTTPEEKCRVLGIHLSVAQDNTRNYDPNKHQNLFSQAGRNGSDTNALSPFFDAIKNFLGNSGNSTNATTDSNATESKSISERFNDFTKTIQGAFASPPVQQALKTGATVADVFLQDYLKGYGVSDACYEDLKTMGQGILEWKDWAQRMLDAFGKPGSNLKNYQIKWLGAYEECLATEAKDYYYTKDGLQSTLAKFSGRYCAVSIPLEQGSLPVQPSIVIGTCMPDSCVSTDIHAVLTAAIEFATGNKTEEDTFTVNCQDEKRKLDTPAIVAIIILSFLGVLMMFGTLYDVVAIQMNRSSNDKHEPQQVTAISTKPGIQNGGFAPDPEISKATLPDDDKICTGVAKRYGATEVAVEDVKRNVVSPARTTAEEKSRGIIEKVLLSFSVYSNGAKILSANQSAGSLGAVNGIRFLSMSWVILGHTIFFANGYDENIFTYFGEQLNNWPFMGIMYASVSVDTFFALSGLLVAYLTLKEIKKAGGIRHFNWGLFYFHRFWRLTPAYMLILMVFTCLMKYWGSGPMWPTDRVPYDNCKESWWTNLLYINNFVNQEKSVRVVFYIILNTYLFALNMIITITVIPHILHVKCIGWTWYLANDMQFYILSPLILIPLFYQIVIGGLVSLVFVSGAIVSTAIIVMNHHYPVQQGQYAPKPDDGDYTKLLYTPCYARIGSYAIGLFTGYLLYRMKCKCRMPKLLVLIGWVVGLFICTSVIYGPYSDKDSHIFSHNESILYHSLHRTGWGVAICWIVFACATGHGGWINEVLSWKPFIPLGRLTYCAYLLHPIVEMNYYMSRRRLVYLNSYEVIYLFLPNLVMSYGVAFLVSLAFESPMMGLEKALLKRDRRS